MFTRFQLHSLQWTAVEAHPEGAFVLADLRAAGGATMVAASDIHGVLEAPGRSGAIEAFRATMVAPTITVSVSCPLAQ